MKKNKFLKLTYLLLLGYVLFIAGCQKFLDRKPLTATLTDLGVGGQESTILGIYSTLNTYAGFNTLPWLDFNSIRGDDAQKGSDINDGKEIITEFQTFQYTKDDWATDTYWNDHYYVINQANIVIDAIESGKFTDAPSLRNYGEAQFFRAYSYFELVKAYGQVPIFRKPILKTSDGVVAKSTVADVYTFIDSSLTAASTNLPLSSAEYGTGYNGRLTQGAANTLWAQTYLFRQNWSRVLALCNQVINSGKYSLCNNFSDIWRDGVAGVGKNGPESIFEIQSTVGAANGDWGSPLMQTSSAWGTCQNVRQNGASSDWNLGWGWNTPTDNLVSAWDSTDPRKSKTILYSGQYDGGSALGGYGATLPAYTNPSGTGGLAQKYWNKKVYSDPAMRTFTGFGNTAGFAGWISHRILRYADVILMKAEAANESGDGATAAAALELIRNRASGNLGASRTIVPYIAFVNQAQMRTAIKNERRWEFAMEGYRFYDLVRWGDALNTLAGLGYTDRCKYYPIPQPALNNNPKLVQNPDWQ